MGYIVHHSIVVTSNDLPLLERLRKRAVYLGLPTSGIVRGEANGVGTFVVAPDGSKEGWEVSDACDEARAQLRGDLMETALDWCEVAMPEDGPPRVLEYSGSGRRLDTWSVKPGDPVADLRRVLKDDPLPAQSRFGAIAAELDDEEE